MTIVLVISITIAIAIIIITATTITIIIPISFPNIIQYLYRMIFHLTMTTLSHPSALPLYYSIQWCLPPRLRLVVVVDQISDADFFKAQRSLGCPLPYRVGQPCFFCCNDIVRDWIIKFLRSFIFEPAQIWVFLFRCSNNCEFHSKRHARPKHWFGEDSNME